MLLSVKYIAQKLEAGCANREQNQPPSEYDEVQPDVLQIEQAELL